MIWFAWELDKTDLLVLWCAWNYGNPVLQAVVLFGKHLPLEGVGG